MLSDSATIIHVHASCVKTLVQKQCRMHYTLEQAPRTGEADRMADNFGHETVKARKRHTCSNCCGEIRPGTFYLRQTYADAGVIQTLRTHPRCAELWFVLGFDPDSAVDCGDFRQECHAYGGSGPFPWESRFYEE
jgi:hypothetical protein